MIDLQKIVAAYGDRCLFAGPRQSIDYRTFLELVEARSKALSDSSSQPIHFHRLEWRADSFADLLARFLAGQSVVLGNSSTLSGFELFAASAPLLILKTGGTTGEPRHVVHSVNTLLTPYALEERPQNRLLVLYAADHIAGIDAFFQALHRGSTLVIPSSMNAKALASCIEEQSVQVLPATPTFLQFLLLSGELEGRDLSSVTTIPHGAEPMPAALRQRISAHFPNARLLQRFGMTELGALPVRADPEYPDAMFLDEPGYDWKVEDGELLIKSPTRMLGTLEEGLADPESVWHRTGDLAEKTPNGSIRVLGRREALINIGGTKVVPEVVEAMILEQPGVRDAAVSAIPNPLTGQALCAKVIFAGEPDVQGLMKALRQASREKALSLAHVPTRIEAVTELAKTAVGKRLRQQGKA
ncbi:long-chain fatty acid--CoA ligase [Puniceicoccales bacterium CK1056]|uniref:Long-chain fatty acid--CoA ligase n=1 Tax=Oceanipulchritudo coccoides TaxID=2706888 RepID=A0A6B2LZP8_9BACT|nr:fatty acid--CoA ligase family protein [Oceanipulchritudo coccoides]NDV61622.1 long-chain fatty acid--CoA ligase [Oceanipulchritudo coccoides]